MRSKLSHPNRPTAGVTVIATEPDRPGSQRASGCGRWIGLLVAIGALAMACNSSDTDFDDDLDANAAGANAEAELEPFAWPEDPSHPVLELTVELPEASGRILVELMPELAPATIVDIIELANEGFYDGTTFHRVIPGFMIQGGDPKSRDRDPTNDGTGRPGRPLHDEFGRAPFVRGVVGMGNKGRADSTSTQFFIMHDDNTNLDGRYTAVGRVLHGIEWVDDITRVAIDRTGRWGPKDRPIENVVIASVRTIGHVAEIRAAIEEEAEGEASSQLAALDSASAEKRASSRGGSAPPAARANDDWEALEANGR